MVRVLLVGDLPSVGRILKMQIELAGDLEVVGETGNKPDLLKLVLTSKPDVIIVDLDMIGMDAIATIRELQLQNPVIPVIAIGLDENEILRLRARNAGAADFIQKQANTSSLIAAIYHAAI